MLTANYAAEDESQGRFIDRNYYLDGVINNNNFVYHDKLFLVGKSSSINLHTYFSQHIIFNYEFNQVKDVKYYQKKMALMRLSYR